MFEDQPIQKTPGQAPGNLPLSEPASPAGGPEDILSKVEKEEVLATPPPPSALDAGILKPKSAENSEDKPVYPPAGEPAGKQGQDVYVIKEPAIAKWLLGIFLAVIVVAVLAGGWWLYKSFVAKDKTKVMETKTETTTEPTVTPHSVPIPPVSQPENKNENLNEQITDEQILFGQPIDSDSDGLDDAHEATLSTDPNNWDTDKDGLSDGDEVLIWKIDPLNSDTDSDSYPDGLEVKNGYNPNGPGKIFEPPTTL